MNKLTFPNSNTPLPPRTLTFTVESEEASEEESDDAEENATSHENEGDGNEIGDVDDNGNKNDSGHLQDNDNETSDSYGASKRTPHRQLGDNTANQKSSPPTVIKQESGHSSSGQNDNDNDNGSEELDSIVEDEPWQSDAHQKWCCNVVFVMFVSLTARQKALSPFIARLA